MPSVLRTAFDFMKQVFNEFFEDDSFSLAAALAYYIVFAMPALLMLIVWIAGLVLDPEDIRGAIEEQIRSLAGGEAARQAQVMISQAEQSVRDKGVIGLLLGIGALIFGATGAFVQLQAALNRVWEVQPDPEAGGVLNFLTKRLLSLGMVLSIAFLLLVSLVLSAALSAFGQALGSCLPGGLGDVVLMALNFVLSLGVFTLLFAAMYRILPDAEIAWRDVWVGAAATALLFSIGKFLIGLYLGQSDPGSAFGAAGSLALLLVWIYYSSLILFLGAEFTQIWARRYGTGIQPAEGAVRIQEKIVKGEAQSEEGHEGTEKIYEPPYPDAPKLGASGQTK